MSFVLPFLLMMLIMAVLHITPFGDNTFLYDDMKRQYIDFYAYYRNVWRGQDSFLYSFSNGLGGNMTGFCAYYLMSPLLILFIFLPQSCFPAAISLSDCLQMRILWADLLSVSAFLLSCRGRERQTLCTSCFLHFLCTQRIYDGEPDQYHVD